MELDRQPLELDLHASPLLGSGPPFWRVEATNAFLQDSHATDGDIQRHRRMITQQLLSSWFHLSCSLPLSFYDTFFGDSRNPADPCRSVLLGTTGLMKDVGGPPQRSRQKRILIHAEEPPDEKIHHPSRDCGGFHMWSLKDSYMVCL